MKIELFDGLSSASDFKQQFQPYAEFNDWNEDKQKSALPLFLKGKAKAVYDAKVQNNMSINHRLKALVEGCAPPKETLLSLNRDSMGIAIIVNALAT